MSESLNPLMGPPQAYVAHPSNGSVGPVIGVLSAIAILGAIAVVIGRLCSGRRVLGRVGYDIEGWVETKCASCIDGRVDPTPPRGGPQRPQRGGGRAGAAVERESPLGSSCGGEERGNVSNRDERGNVSGGEERGNVSGREERGNGAGRPGQHDPCESV